MQLVANYSCSTGEGPLWHPDEELLYWVDIPVGCLYSYDPNPIRQEKFYSLVKLGALLSKQTAPYYFSWKKEQLDY